MTSTFKPKADPLLRRDGDSGYRVAWKYKYKFERGHFDEEMTYGEARKRAADLQAKEPEKVFWPEMLYE